jgi:hypothetical protein
MVLQPEAFSNWHHVSLSAKVSRDSCKRFNFQTFSSSPISQKQNRIHEMSQHYSKTTKKFSFFIFFQFQIRLHKRRTKVNNHFTNNRINSTKINKFYFNFSYNSFFSVQLKYLPFKCKTKKKQY